VGKKKICSWPIAHSRKVRGQKSDDERKEGEENKFRRQEGMRVRRNPAKNNLNPF
jgi:hypothetical protein